jgi:hypothetical protein
MLPSAQMTSVCSAIMGSQNSAQETHVMRVAIDLATASSRLPADRLKRLVGVGAAPGGA